MAEEKEVCFVELRMTGNRSASFSVPTGMNSGKPTCKILGKDDADPRTWIPVMAGIHADTSSDVSQPQLL